MATLVNKSEQSHAEVAEANKVEIERLSVQHRVVKHAMGGQLIFAPIDMSKPGLRILDSATADGLWLREVQATAPSPRAHGYVGFDINTGLFPNSLPPATELVQQSLAEPLPATWHGTFDLMNQRFAMAAAISAPLQPIISGFAAVLKPGGWLQLTEMDGDAAQGNAVVRITDLVRGILTVVRGEPSVTHATPELLTNAGFVDIGQRQDTVYVGAMNQDPRMKRESVRSMMLTLEGLLGAAKHMPPGALGEGLDELPAWAEKDMAEKGGSWRVKTFWARKPE